MEKDPSAESSAADAADAAPLPAPSPAGLPSVTLKTHEDRRIRRGHLWVFSNEVDSAPAAIQPGAAVRFLTRAKTLLGTGFYNPRSLIAGRLMDRGEVALDAAFFERRLRMALSLRRRLFKDDSYRWVHGESDDLPGLVVDRFDGVVVIESHCAGMDALLAPLVEAIKAVGNLPGSQPLPDVEPGAVGPAWDAIVLKNEGGFRRLEGLADRVEVLEGDLSRPHWFGVDGVRTAADLLEGQKTGFFFDQRWNRRAVAGLSAGRKVLDVFCHTGGFGLMAAAAGAESVWSVDDSASALELAKHAAQENGLSEKMRFEKAEGFQFLGGLKESFDVVVIDPPKFAPSKKHLAQAEEAYIRLNALAFRRVTGGGFLATSSCSQHVDRETFRQIISRAAHQAGRRARIVQWGGAGPDHPVRPSMPETEYLKFALVHVS
jgi:23S rRNA (cytosine1962-C5)-methyltransferase